MQQLIGIILALFSLAPSALAADSLSALANTKEWQRILHYKPHLLRGFRSAVDGPGFFIAENGATDPEAEMRATLAAFKEPDLKWGKRNQPVQCAFPARFKFLNERLGLHLPTPHCALFHEFMQRFQPRSATLVFSAAYPDNPASMFGHTFLRINRQDAKGDLLDNSLSYAANIPPDENNFAFLWFGVTGGYPGQLSMIPYYAKVNEYSNSENRDLWEYELNLNAEQTWWLLASAWEIETNGYLDYFFFDDNCSWLILALLEVARSDWNLSNFSLAVIPGETVKRLTRTPGAVRAVRFRPSLFKKMRQAVESLPADLLQEYRAVLARDLTPRKVRKSPVLNAVMARLHYEKQKDAASFSQTELLQQTLLARSSIKNAEEIALTPIPETTRPDLGHDASRLGLATNLRFYDLQWKTAYHDLYNSDSGYAAFSEVSFPGITLRYNRKTKNFFVAQIEGISLVSLQPVTDAVTPLSWRARVAFDRIKDLCETCRGGRAEGGVGLSLINRSEQNAVWSLMGVRTEASKHLQGNIRGLGFGEFGLGRSWNSTHKTILIARYLPRIFGAHASRPLYEGELVHSVRLSPQWEVRGVGETSRQLSEVKIQLNRYF